MAGLVVVGVWLVGKLAEVGSNTTTSPIASSANLHVEEKLESTNPKTQTSVAPVRPTVTSSSQPLSSSNEQITQPNLTTDEPLEEKRRGHVPRSIPTGPAANRAQARAVEMFPELGVNGSLFNRFFVARVLRYQIEKPEIFDDPDWAVLIARETERNLK